MKRRGVNNEGEPEKKKGLDLFWGAGQKEGGVHGGSPGRGLATPARKRGLSSWKRPKPS